MIIINFFLMSIKKSKKKASSILIISKLKFAIRKNLKTSILSSIKPHLWLYYCMNSLIYSFLAMAWILWVSLEIFINMLRKCLFFFLILLENWFFFRKIFPYPSEIHMIPSTREPEILIFEKKGMVSDSELSAFFEKNP